MRIAFFGSSLVSSYWNGAATYYRGLLKAMARLGHEITFYEPDAYERQRHRDMADPNWARVVVYPATSDAWRPLLESAARECDLLVKASGIGVFDPELEMAVPEVASPAVTTVFWDVDAPATLDAIEGSPAHHMRRMIPRYHMVLTYGGGEPVVRAYRKLGAHHCQPIYNALDPETHYPVAVRPDFACDLSLLANRLPDREARVEEFFLAPAAQFPHKRFLLGGSGWETKTLPLNVRLARHVGTRDHNAFFASAAATLNINRESMARYGFSPPTRIFEAAGAAACIITDAWEGIELFFEPGKEILVTKDREVVAEELMRLAPGRAHKLAAAAYARVLSEHTYAQRAFQVSKLLDIEAKRNGAA
jgi:spore maturation protein CgeB